MNAKGELALGKQGRMGIPAHLRHALGLDPAIG